MSPVNDGVDRPAAIRRALLELVAERGFHGTSMAAVAARAGVATGTAYVHYPSKDALVLATYGVVKYELGAAAVAGLEPTTPPAERFRRMWRQIHAHLAADPPRAQFLSQMESSPYARAEPIDPRGEPSPLVAATLGSDMAELLAPLPPRVLYDLALGPATRIAAASNLDDTELDAVAAACWRAVTTS